MDGDRRSRLKAAGAICYAEPHGNRKERREYDTRANPTLLVSITQQGWTNKQADTALRWSNNDMEKAVKMLKEKHPLESAEEMEVVDEDESTQDMDSTVENETDVDMEVFNHQPLPLSTSPNDSTHAIAISFSLVDVTSQHIEHARSIGASIVESVEDTVSAKVVITSIPVMWTAKNMIANNKGILVGIQWLEQSSMAGFALPVDSFHLLSNGGSGDILERVSVGITSVALNLSSCPSRNDLQFVVSSGGGFLLSLVDAPVADGHTNRIVVTGSDTPSFRETKSIEGITSDVPTTIISLANFLDVFKTQKSLIVLSQDTNGSSSEVYSGVTGRDGANPIADTSASEAAMQPVELTVARKPDVGRPVEMRQVDTLVATTSLDAQRLPPSSNNGMILGNLNMSMSTSLTQPDVSGHKALDPNDRENVHPNSASKQVEKGVEEFISDKDARRRRIAEQEQSSQAKPSSSLSFNSLGSHAPKSTSSALRKKESASISFARKPSPLQRSVAAPSSSNNKPNQSVVSSSSQGRRKKPKTKPLNILASNKEGVRIEKPLQVRWNAFPVAKSCVETYKDDAQKQATSLANTERRRNSCGDNDDLHNSISMMCLAATKMGAGDFFSPSLDPNGRLDSIQNILAKYPNFNTGIATTMLSLVTIVKTPGYNCFAPESVRKMSDYGGDYNKGGHMLRSFPKLGAIVVTDGTTVTADNAHEKTVLILHNMMKHDNQDELKTLKTLKRGDQVDIQRYDCLNCNNAIANVGGGGMYCVDCIPEYCTASLDSWKTNRYAKATGKGQSMMLFRNSLNEVSKKWNGKKESWNGCGAVVSPSSGSRFFCVKCTLIDNALRE